MLHLAENKLPGTSSKTKSASNKKKREELRATMAEASHEVYKLHRSASWNVVVKTLCERIAVTSPLSDKASTFEVTTDRCIFRTVSPILRVTLDENEDGNEEADPVYCQVRAEVLPLATAVVFDVWDPLTSTQWRAEYPDSRELLREFVVETFLEQQMHLEAIVMSLLLQSNAETGELELRFDE